MLSVPQYGWVEISLGDWKDRASYLTNIPHDLLDSFINVLGHPGCPAAVSCDAEGWEYILVFDWYTSYIIESKDEEKLYVIDKKLIDLAEELYSDISNNIVAWSTWDFNIESEERRLKEEELLREKLVNLNCAIEKYKNRFKSRV